MGVKRTIKRNGASGGIKIGEAWDEFLSERGSLLGVETKTMKGYFQAFKYWCQANQYTTSSLCGGIKIESIDKFVMFLVERNPDISTSSLNHYVGNVRPFLYWAMEREYVSPFKIKLNRQQETKPRTFSDEEVAALLVEPKTTDNFTTWRTYAIVSFMLATGARPATLSFIGLEDVDFKNQRITYTHMKTKDVVVAYMSEGLKRVLQRYLRLWKLDEWLFPSVSGGQGSTEMYHQAFVKYCEDRGVDRTDLYGLRHTFAANYAEKTKNPFKLKQVLGHKTIAMSSRYVRLFAEDVSDGYEAASVLDQNLSTKGRKQTVRRKQHLNA